MNNTSPLARLIWGITHGLAGIFFFFSIIGVFGQITAIACLLVFILIAVASIVQTAGAEG
jgi:hypothetical protein